MTRAGFALTLLCAAALPAAAQNIPRIKATVVSFDGSYLTVRADGETGTMKVGIRPATRIMKEEQKSLSDIHPGDFVGATLNKSSMGVLVAQEVHIFPESLRGSGEGLYPTSPGASHFVLDGTVGIVNPTTLGIRFRGAGGEGVNCSGRAPLNPLDGCQGSSTISVPAAVPVLALSPSDKNEIKPGSVLALSLMAGTDGRLVSPGLTIEEVATPPVMVPPAQASASPSRAKRPQ